MKTSDLFRRAKQLADLEGSNFISWNEAENCINEAYIGLYEKLINMGDNSFVASFRTSEKEIELPSDFWQLKGVFLWNNGNLQTINRRADNNGIHHLSYEMRNGKIYLFGNPTEILVEYYQKPKYLTMPPVDAEVSLNIPEGSEVLSCFEHTFVYKTKDDEDNDIICVYDIDGIKNAYDIFETFDVTKIWIAKDFVFTIEDGDLIIYDLAAGVSATFIGGVPLVTESGNLFVISNAKVNEIALGGDGYELKEVADFTLEDGGDYYISDDNFKDFYSLVDGVIYHNGESLEETAKAIIYADNKCYFVVMNKAGVIEEEEVKVIKMGIGSPVGFISININTGYGYCTKKYGKYFVCAYCEDTELNFPNSFYFQMLSYLLAISFRSKQGADITLLSAQLEMVSQTFEDTLGSDAFQFPRMGNVYN